MLLPHLGWLLLPEITGNMQSMYIAPLEQQQVLIHSQDCFGQKPCHAKLVLCQNQNSRDTMEDSLEWKL